MASATAVLRLGLALVAGYVLAWRAEPMLRNRGRLAAWGAWFTAIGLLLLPLAIPASAIGWRAVAAIACTEWMFKLLDYRRCALAERGDGNPPGRHRYATFLVPFFPPVQVSWELHVRRGPAWISKRRALRHLAVGTVLIAGGFLLLLGPRPAALGESFAVDHAIVFMAFLPTIEGISLGLLGLEYLAGFGTAPLLRGILRSQTPAEFWLRYNTRVHRWLRENVFVPAGGVRRPVWGIVLTFLASGVLHEGMFAIATSVLDGRQFAFFALQAPAVLVSPVLERFARTRGLGGTVVAHTLTILWFYATSILFFRGVQRVFPFLYATPI